ncbi:MAG: radical SAM protein [Candidatus Omnitrophota bacterium]
MKILFVLKETTMYERMGVMYLSSALKSQGNKVKLVLAESMGIERLKDFVRSYSPEIIGYSAMTGEYNRLVEINKHLKNNHDFLAVFGGPHPTFYPKIIEDEGCDAIFIGEGDITFPEFCRRIEQKENYWETPGTIVKYAGQIIRNPLMPLVEDLDSLPFPDRDLMYSADQFLMEGSSKIFFSTRGCPSKCTYCFNEKYNEIFKGKGRILRHRSPENLVEEISEVKKKYPLDIVYLLDDTFLYKPVDWFNKFKELYKENINLPFSCNVRPNAVTEQNISLLKDVGLVSVNIGIECGNEDVANTVLQRHISNSQIINACRILQKYGIKISTLNIVGLPVKNSYQVDLETLDLNIKIKPTFALASILCPYPGTPIETYSRENGFIANNSVFLETNKRASVLNFSSKMEKRRIENLHKLFGIIVEFSFLRKFTTFLSSLPLTRVYTSLFYLWYGYNYKIRLFPFRSIRKELGSYLRFWWKMIQKN